MNIQLIDIEQLQKNGYPRVLRPQKSSEYEYVGIAIEDQGSHYYWARGEFKNYRTGVSLH